MGRPLVIVASHNQVTALERLLDSLASQTTDHEVVVVDNASTDGTSSMLRHRPAVDVIRFEENVGFGRAVNEAVRVRPDGDPLVLVNDDAVCEPSFVEQLCAALGSSDDVVMSAGVLLQREDSRRIDSAGIVFDRTLLAVDYLHGEPVDALHRARDPLGPTGGAAAFDRRAFESVGGFDERFFAYLEDVDLVARLLRAGGRCALARDAHAVHRHASTLGSGSGRKNELMGWGRGYIVAKYRLHRRPRLFAQCVLGEFLIATGQLLVDRTAAGLVARARGFRAGCRGPAEELPPLPAGSASISFRKALRSRARRAAARSGRTRS